MSAVDPSTYDVDPGRGWIIFAGGMLALAGVLNVLYGIAGIGNSKVFVRDAEYVLGNLKTWGWILLIAGLVQLVAAFGVWAATEWGRWIGVLAAAVNMLVQFFALPSFPGRALLLFFVDVIIIYGLLTYGGRDRHNLGDWN
jgi:hypothetical protein